MLSAGMDADLVVLDRDPFAADDIGQIRVALTMVGGRITFEGGAK
jgi:predicted amidohydrolase YtcJ